MFEKNGGGPGSGLLRDCSGTRSSHHHLWKTGSRGSVYCGFDDLPKKRVKFTRQGFPGSATKTPASSAVTFSIERSTTWNHGPPRDRGATPHGKTWCAPHPMQYPQRQSTSARSSLTMIRKTETAEMATVLHVRFSSPQHESWRTLSRSCLLETSSGAITADSAVNDWLSPSALPRSFGRTTSELGAGIHAEPEDSDD